MTILHNIQNELPLCTHPFNMLSDGKMDEKTVIKLIKNFKEIGVIRRISALFNSKRLGYVTTLIAMKVPDEKFEEVTKIINEYDEVTHNYEREDEYNMWFTIIAPSNAEFERLINEIRQKTKIDHILNLPTLNRFKINTTFRIPNLPFKQDLQEIMHEDLKKQQVVIIDELDKKIFKQLQDIPIVSKPYQLISDRLQIPQQYLFKKIESYKKLGIIRNIRAVLDHYKIGLKENVMVVFKVAKEDIPKVVKVMIAYPQITHCYERLTSDTWQYNLFTVIHEKTKTECEKIISEILTKTGIKEYKKLYTKRELKKANPRYF
jgi:DNA-binding Lrp family transcriptional regulator